MKATDAQRAKISKSKNRMVKPKISETWYKGPPGTVVRVRRGSVGREGGGPLGSSAGLRWFVLVKVVKKRCRPARVNALEF